MQSFIHHLACLGTPSYSFLVLELNRSLDFDPPSDDDFFSALPASPAVCLIESKSPSAQPLFIRTQDLRRRLQRLLGPPDPASKRLNLRDFAKTVRYRVTSSAFEQTLAYYQTAKQLFLERYKDMLGMRPPAVLKVNLGSTYPRCYPTRRISTDAQGNPSGGVYYGPFPSRKAASLFSERVLDLFKVRRCQIKIRRDPTFPGCIYSEMKMCLAPCFAGCTKEDYDAEVQRVVAFLETRGGSLREALEAERNRASHDLDYEKAALLHKKLDKLDEALRLQPELPRRLQHLNAVILQQAAAEQSISVYQVRSGRIAEPLELSFSSLAGDPRSAEQRLRQHLEAPPAEAFGAAGTTGPSENPARSAADLSEHLWLLARWFYSNPRQGEIFFRTNAWPYRKMLRACARLLAPPRPPQDPKAAEPGQESEETS